MAIDIIARALASQGGGGGGSSSWGSIGGDIADQEDLMALIDARLTETEIIALLEELYPNGDTTKYGDGDSEVY